MKRFLIGGSCALVALMLLLGAASISYTEYQYNIDVATNLTVHGQISCDGRILGDIVTGTNGFSAGSGAATTSMTNLFNVGASAGSGQSLLSANDVFNFGYQSGQNAIYDDSSGWVYNIGDTVGDSMALTNSGDVFNYGSVSGKSMALTNGWNIHNFGDNAGEGLSATDSSFIYNFGDLSAYQMTLIESTDIYSFGTYAGNDATLDTSGNVYFYGDYTGQQSALTNSESIYAFGGLESAVLNDTKDLVTIGKSAGNSISGAYTNVVLIGDGATIGATGQNQVILGPSMTLISSSLSATNLVFQRTRVIRQALTHAGGTVTLNMATNVPGYSVLTLTGAVTFASSGLVDGSQYDLLFFSSGASNTITWGPEFRFPSFRPSYISATNSAGQATIGRLWCEAYGTNIIATYAEEP